MTYNLMVCAAAIGSLMLCVWMLSLYLTDVSVVDIAWGIGFVLVAWTSYLLYAEAGGNLLIPVLVTLWGLRLSGYLAWRNHGEPEDPRYQKMRAHWGDAFRWVSLLTVFGAQAVVMWIVSLPVQTVYVGTADDFWWLSVAGTLVFSVGLLFESVGDWQLARFKADEANHGKVLDSGLWRFTRHPNYFGDFLVWWGIFLAAMGQSQQWWTILGPLVMSVFLMRISGVTLLESSLKNSKPGYQAYIDRTNAFFPGPPAG